MDVERFDPALRDETRFPGRLNVLYAGRLTTEKGLDRLAQAFLAARERDSRLHLVLAGGGPEEPMLRERLGEAATFLGWLRGRELAVAYASADVFAFPSVTDTFGQVVLEAQASGLPVVAVNAGGPASLIADGETGLLTGPEPGAFADGLLAMVADPARYARIRKTAQAVARSRTWEASMGRLAAGYRTALLARPRRAPATSRSSASADDRTAAPPGRRRPGATTPRCHGATTPRCRRRRRPRRPGAAVGGPWSFLSSATSEIRTPGRELRGDLREPPGRNPRGGPREPRGRGPRGDLPNPPGQDHDPPARTDRPWRPTGSRRSPTE